MSDLMIDVMDKIMNYAASFNNHYKTYKNELIIDLFEYHTCDNCALKMIIKIDQLIEIQEKNKKEVARIEKERAEKLKKIKEEIKYHDEKIKELKKYHPSLY